MPAWYSVGSGSSSPLKNAAKRLRSPSFVLRVASVGGGVLSLLASANTASSESASWNGVMTRTAWRWYKVLSSGLLPDGLLVRWYAWLLQTPRIKCFRSNPLPANSRASAASRSGCEGLLSSVMSSTGSTSPRPKNWCHTRLTPARAKYGFSGDATHSARAGRNGPFAGTAAFPPRRKAGATVFDDGGTISSGRDFGASSSFAP